MRRYVWWDSVGLLCMWVCEVSLYIYLHEYLDLFKGRKVDFCAVCSGTCIKYQSRTQLSRVIELYGVVWNRCRDTWSFLLYSSQVYVVIGMWSIFPKWILPARLWQSILYTSEVLHSIHYIFLPGLSFYCNWRWLVPWNLSRQTSL